MRRIFVSHENSGSIAHASHLPPASHCMDDGETAADGLDFTPPATPSQHYKSGIPMDGAMGTSPSKDDAGAGAAAGSQGGSQMSQPEDSGGILASLGPLTSPSNPTAGDAGGGVKADSAAAAAAGAAAADEGSDDDDDMTPSMYVSPQRCLSRCFLYAFVCSMQIIIHLTFPFPFLRNTQRLQSRYGKVCTVSFGPGISWRCCCLERERARWR